MASFTLAVGTPVFFGFVEEDQNGQPMVTPVAGTAAWSNTTPATGTLTPSPSGQSATYTPVAAGADTVNFTLTVGDETFSATAAITVAGAAQTLTAVQIVEIPALV